MMIEYFDSIKAIHLGCVVLSGGLFLVRGLWRLRESPRAARFWARRAPHLIDTLFLGSAILMVLVLGLNPLVTPWLAAKILALVLYVGLGSAVMRSSKRRTRMCCFLLANLVYVYIIAVAFSKSPLPGLI